jgi:DNA-directed RNA polymerase specialized sigma24 family protein
MRATEIKNLATACEEETRKFYLGGAHDTTHCYELIRQALTEQSSEAFSHLYRIYEPMVTRWVYRCAAFPGIDEPAEYFVSTAFSKFYFALRGRSLDRFETLSKLLTYLKSCVITAVLEYRRKYGRQEIVTAISIDDKLGIGAEDVPESPLIDVWSRICHLLPGPEDQLLARCAFVLHMKPAEIAETYAEHWESPRQVTQRLFRIRQVLRNDLELQRLADG